MLIRPSLKQTPTLPALPHGERVYAIGDIHGRYDLLCRLMFAIEEDTARRPAAQTRIVVLGDFIDRGPATAKVIAVLSALRESAGLIVLKGNHEAALVDGVRGDRAALEAWIEYGGDETLRSFGASDEDIWPADTRMLISAVRKIIPERVIEWLSDLPLSHRAGSYLFVHAGIKPGVAFAKQRPDDLIWIRDEFIDSTADHGAIVVHGHTISERVCVLPNRIGVDTGAYRTGRLSAVGLEGGEIWTIEAS
jgi:serine/threonine protein phosphatase 1